MAADRAGIRVLAAVGAAAVLLGAAGCGSKGQDTAPAACLANAGGYLHALQAAPGPVRLPGGVPISDCLVPNQSGGQLADVGRSMVVAASRLNVSAQRDPAGPAPAQLGYLLGAVAKGSDPIHTELVRRLNAAARFSAKGGTLPAKFERAFGRGYAAGHTSG